MERCYAGPRSCKAQLKHHIFFLETPDMFPTIENLFPLQFPSGKERGRTGGTYWVTLPSVAAGRRWCWVVVRSGCLQSLCSHTAERTGPPCAVRAFPALSRSASCGVPGARLSHLSHQGAQRTCLWETTVRQAGALRRMLARSEHHGSADAKLT